MYKETMTAKIKLFQGRGGGGEAHQKLVFDILNTTI